MQNHKRAPVDGIVIVVSVVVVGGLSALMIYGIKRMRTRSEGEMPVRRLWVGQLDAKIGLKVNEVNEKVQEMNNVVAARPLRERYGQWDGMRSPLGTTGKKSPERTC